MANFRRKKTKRRVHCQICTPHRWRGNNTGRFKPKEEFARKQTDLGAELLAIFAQWNAEDDAMTPEEIARAEAGWKEIERDMAARKRGRG